MAKRDIPLTFAERQPQLGHAPALYVMATDTDGPVKIGFSSDISVRVRMLQTGNPLLIQVMGMRLILPRFIPSGATPNIPALLKQSACKIERGILTEVQKIGLRMMGEWLDLSADEAIEVIDKVASNMRLRALSREWLLTSDARHDPEIGWVRHQLLNFAATAEAQAARVNDTGLTSLRKTGLISSSEGS